MRTNSLSDRAYIDELLIYDNEIRIQEILYIKLRIFKFLYAELRRYRELKSSRYIFVRQVERNLKFGAIRSNSAHILRFRAILEQFAHISLKFRSFYSIQVNYPKCKQFGHIRSIRSHSSNSAQIRAIRLKFDSILDYSLDASLDQNLRFWRAWNIIFAEIFNYFNIIV